MAQPLIECIPNFSEARRPEVMDAIVKSILAVPGVNVLDRHSDIDHNRTVITMVGAPAAVEEAAFQSIKKSQELIDLNQRAKGFDNDKIIFFVIGAANPAKDSLLEAYPDYVYVDSDISQTNDERIQGLRANLNSHYFILLQMEIHPHS